MTHEKTIEAYFAAMRRGSAAEADMMSLFTDDIVYVEPFSGATEPATGRAAVRERLRAGWEYPLPDMELEVHRVIVDGDTATSEWTCRSPGLPAPSSGTDTYTFRDGLISRLEVRLEP